MPSFILTQSTPAVGAAIDAIACNPCVGGSRDRCSDVPVKVKLTGNGMLFDWLRDESVSVLKEGRHDCAHDRAERSGRRTRATSRA